MELLSEIKINRQDNGLAFIQLLQGDLTAIPREHATDILVVSAFPGDYRPIPNTLMAAFNEKKLDIGELAKTKEIDLVSQLGCWLSEPLDADQQRKFNIKQVLCFEPGASIHGDQTIVGNIFRCINTFAFDENIHVVTMPVVASGNQKIPLEKMLPALLDAAIFWLESGLPLNVIKLVLYTDSQVDQAFPVFDQTLRSYELKSGTTSKNDLSEPACNNDNIPSVIDDLTENFSKNILPQPTPGKSLPDALYPLSPNQDSGIPRSGQESLVPEPAGDSKYVDYDFFISYAHTQTGLVNTFVDKMRQHKTELNIFYDKTSIPVGGLWIKQISDAIQRARKVLVFLSPDYDNSPVCWDEFQCAKLMEYRRKIPVIQTIYLYNYTGEMPPIMGIYSYVDCREGDMLKLEACIPSILT